MSVESGLHSKAYTVGNKAKDFLPPDTHTIRQKCESQNGRSKKTKHTKFFRKNEHFLPQKLLAVNLKKINFENF